MIKATRYTLDVRKQSVVLALEDQGEHESQWAAICSVAGKIDCTPKTLRKWAHRAEDDLGGSGVPSRSERGRLKELEREGRELRIRLDF